MNSPIHVSSQKMINIKQSKLKSIISNLTNVTLNRLECILNVLYNLSYKHTQNLKYACAFSKFLLQYFPWMGHC